MGQRHKHADIITAWAEGAEIEYRKSPEHTWNAAEFPGWYENYEYRVKPTARKYRVALLSADHYTTTADTEADAAFISCSAAFVRWLTDWVEYSD